ncbi:MAG TPA: phosphohistidine phosphatase SixA [Kofleriaceae bacterium]|jgi:phosphohistidine phosphatase
MQLYVIRHAIAEDHAEGQSDSERRLTRDGIKRLKRVVKGLRALDISFERILSSPWSRALETAEGLESICDERPIVTDLLCQSPRAELLSMISETGTDTAVVGHEPWLGELVAWLAFGDTRHGDALILKKSGIVCLEGTAVPGGMQIAAIVPPKILSAAHS